VEKNYFSLTDRSIKKQNKVMPRTPDQYREMREEKKGLIMKSALELFANHGFHGTSITDIAAHARISKGLLYNYFQSKDELILEILLKGFNELLKVFDPNKVEARFFTAMLDGISMNYVFDPITFPLTEIKNRLLEIYHLNN